MKFGTQDIFRFILVTEGLRNIKTFKSFFLKQTLYLESNIE